MLVASPSKRIDIKTVRKHPWLSEGNLVPPSHLIPPRPAFSKKKPLDMEIMQMVKELGFDTNEVFITGSPAFCVYYLIFERRKKNKAITGEKEEITAEKDTAEFKETNEHNRKKGERKEMENKEEKRKKNAGQRSLSTNDMLNKDSLGTPSIKTEDSKLGAAAQSMDMMKSLGGTAQTEQVANEKIKSPSLSPPISAISTYNNHPQGLASSSAGPISLIPLRMESFSRKYGRQKKGLSGKFHANMTRSSADLISSKREIRSYKSSDCLIGERKDNAFMVNESFATSVSSITPSSSHPTKESLKQSITSMNAKLASRSQSIRSAISIRSLASIRSMGSATSKRSASTTGSKNMSMSR